MADQNPNAIDNQCQLTAEQLAAVKAFIEQVGGIENARRAVDAIRESMKAA